MRKKERNREWKKGRMVKIRTKNEKRKEEKKRKEVKREKTAKRADNILQTSSCATMLSPHVEYENALSKQAF